MIDFKQKMEEMEKQERRQRTGWSEEDQELIVNNKKRKRIVTYTIAVIVIALIFSGRVIMSSQNATNWFSENIFLNKLRHLIPSADKQLKGEENDRINILLLGMGGEGHDGAYLTDTMMLASIKPSTKQVSLISFPRDLVTPVSSWQKLNSVNAYAEQKNSGSGGEVTSQAFSELLQIPIDYYIRVDFNGFSNIIDELGGIEVNVENTLDDYSYPIYGQEDNPDYYARFEHLHIDKGLQVMNGSLALKYTRSRHGYGIEGSDFARAKRQQLVLEAIKNKILSRQTLLNPMTIGKLINEFSQDISTNLSVWETVRLWDMTKDVDRAQISNKVLSDAPDGLLAAGKGEDGAYILMPRSGNFAEIKNLVQNIFTVGGNQETPKKIEMITDNAKIIILNGTWITGLAGKNAVLLEQAKFEVLKTGNAPTRDYTRTTVYDLSFGKKNSSLNVLKRIAGATQAFDSPEWLKDYQTATSTVATSSLPDFLLVIGTDANRAE